MGNSNVSRVGTSSGPSVFHGCCQRSAPSSEDLFNGSCLHPSPVPTQGTFALAMLLVHLLHGLVCCGSRFLEDAAHAFLFPHLHFGQVDLLQQGRRSFLLIEPARVSSPEALSAGGPSSLVGELESSLAPSSVDLDGRICLGISSWNSIAICLGQIGRQRERASHCICPLLPSARAGDPLDHPLEEKGCRPKGDQQAPPFRIECLLLIRAGTLVLHQIRFAGHEDRLVELLDLGEPLIASGVTVLHPMLNAITLEQLSASDGSVAVRSRYLKEGLVEEHPALPQRCWDQSFTGKDVSKPTQDQALCDQGLS